MRGQCRPRPRSSPGRGRRRQRASLTSHLPVSAGRRGYRFRGSAALAAAVAYSSWRSFRLKWRVSAVYPSSHFPSALHCSRSFNRKMTRRMAQRHLPRAVARRAVCTPTEVRAARDGHKPMHSTVGKITSQAIRLITCVSADGPRVRGGFRPPGGARREPGRVRGLACRACQRGPTLSGASSQ